MDGVTTIRQFKQLGQGSHLSCLLFLEYSNINYVRKGDSPEWSVLYWLKYLPQASVTHAHLQGDHELVILSH